MAGRTGKRGGARSRAAGAADAPGGGFGIRRLGLGDVLALVRVCNQSFFEHARFPEMGANAVRYIREFPEWQWGAFEIAGGDADTRGFSGVGGTMSIPAADRPAGLTSSSSPLATRGLRAEVGEQEMAGNTRGEPLPRFSSGGAPDARKPPPGDAAGVGSGRMLGFLLTEPREGTARVAIRLIATDPGATGRGIGGRLLATCAAQARAGGVPLLSVGTPFARGFYEKQGFRCTKTDLKVIREILRRRVEPPEGLALRPLDAAGAAAVVGALETDELRAKFLTACLESFRRSPGLALVAERGGQPAAVAVGRTSDFYRDFAEATFLHGFGAPVTLPVRCFESAVSAMGLRFVGFHAGNGTGPSRELAALGYRRAEEDFYWTMYTLEKPLT